MKVLQVKARKKQSPAAGFRTIRRKRQSNSAAFNPVALLSRSTERDYPQAKLKVGSPGDIYEQEADHTAEQVMSMPEPVAQRQIEEEQEQPIQAHPLAEQITPLVQRQPEEEEVQKQPQEEEEVQKQPEDDETAQAKGGGGGPSAVSTPVERGINSIKGGGWPLPESTRAFFQPRFSADFSGVRIHTDSNAAHLARSVNARALTHGQDVVFGSGQYSPETSDGKKLLAHELTHVNQQNPFGNVLRKIPDAEVENKPGSSTKNGKGTGFVVDLSLPKKNPTPDYNKTEEQIGAWEKAVFHGVFSFKFSTKTAAKSSGKSGSYVSTLSVSFKNPGFSVHIARHLMENMSDWTKSRRERIVWRRIHRRVRTHAFVHLERFRAAANKMENEIHKSIKSLPTSKKPLAVSEVDLQNYLKDLGKYRRVLVEREFWKTTCDWEKEDYPKLFKGLKVWGSLKVNCGTKPKLPPLPLPPIKVKSGP